jgi:superfamily I DNA and/or RNA helicase
VNIEFLKKIKQKLQVGNTRSIHLNAYPGRLAARLDLNDLNYIKQNLPNEFIKKLLNSPSFEFKFKIEQNENPLYTADIESTLKGEPAPENAGATAPMVPTIPTVPVDKKDKEIKLIHISKRLSSIYYENEDTYLEHGIKTFGFGYPNLIYGTKGDPTKILSAPVFIWMLGLTRDKNEWIISRDEEQAISVNDVLLNYLEQDVASTGFSKLNEEYLSDSVIDETEFTEIVNKLLQQINSSAAQVSGQHLISPMLDKEKRVGHVKTFGNPSITYSGIFGLFKTPKEPLIRDIKYLISKADSLAFDKLRTNPYQEIKYSAVETDPTQEHALKSLGNNSKLIIHGPPGTGKSQTLTAIIVNALFNKSKCLVVCEKGTALEVIRKNLTTLGLGSLCGLIEDVNRDRKYIVDAVRDPKPHVKPVRRGILDNIFAETDEAIEGVNKNHAFYNKFLLNDMTWGDLVGKYIRENNSNEDHLKLYSELKNCDIDFTSERVSEIYNSTLNFIKKNRSLFKTAKAELGTFRILNDDLFTERSAKDIVLELDSKIKGLLNELKSSSDRLNALHKSYSAALSSNYTDYNSKFQSELNNIVQLYQTNCEINKNLFTQQNSWANFRLSFLSVFSGKYKQLKKDKNNIIPRLYSLKDFQKTGYFDFAINDIKESLTELEPQLDNINRSLKNWYSSINEYKEQKLSQYSAANFDKYAFKDNAMLNESDNSANNVLKSVNDSGLFASNYKFESDSIMNKLQTLSDLHSKLNIVVKDINSLYDYFYWRSDYLKCNDQAKKIIDKLIELGIEDWFGVSDQYFTFNALLVNESNIKLRDNSLFDEITGNLAQVKDFQLNIILEYWQSRQSDSAAKFEERTGININALYNKSRNSKYQKRNSLRKIIAADHEVFTDHFPVMLVNPVVCSSLFEMREGLFDLVIFDEASQLRVEDIYAAKLRGKYRIVSGDENQMPPSNYFAASQLVIESDSMSEDEEEVEITTDPGNLADAESLLEFAIRRGYNEAYLDIHYRSRHPDLIDFSNAAFYNSRLNPMPPVQNYKALRYFNVCGIYNQAEGINKQEAEKVIGLISELINPEKGNDNPSIGVATFNILQRNYILDMINYAANSDSSFAQKVSILMNKPSEPFFVKNLENIQGDERDVVIISTTFGKRADGSFLQSFGPINQEKGFRLLNVIVTRAKHMMIVCTSIPDEFIREYPTLLAASGNKGKGVFYAYLAYVKAIEEYDPKSKNAVLEHLMANSEAKEQGINRLNKTMFEDEVYNSLCKHFPAERLVMNYSTGGFLIDIAVLPEDKSGKITAIECDGSSLHNSPEAYAWDIFREKHIKAFGMKFFRIWSVNWWNNSHRELERLVSFINENNLHTKEYI